MTKVKAFFICLLIPLVVIWVPMLFPLEGGENLGWVVRWLLWLLLTPLSLFVPAYALKREFRKYGLYGTLLGTVLISILILYVTA